MLQLFLFNVSHKHKLVLSVHHHRERFLFGTAKLDFALIYSTFAFTFRYAGWRCVKRCWIFTHEEGDVLKQKVFWRWKIWALAQKHSKFGYTTKWLHNVDSRDKAQQNTELQIQQQPFSGTNIKWKRKSPHSKPNFPAFQRDFGRKNDAMVLCWCCSKQKQCWNKQKTQSKCNTNNRYCTESEQWTL